MLNTESVMTARTVLVLLVLWGAFMPTGVAGEEGAPVAPPSPPKVSPSDLFREDVIRGVGSLRSGAFAGTWSERRTTPQKGSSFQYSGKIRGLFDDSLGCYALRRTSWVFHNRRGSFAAIDYGIIRTPDEVIRFDGVGSKILRHAVGERPKPGDLSAEGEYFDPRLAGLFWLGNFLRGDIFRPEQSAGLDRVPIRIEVEEGQGAEGRTRYDWESLHTLKSLWVEPAPGGGALLPVRLVRRARYPDVDDNAWSIPLETQQVTWTHVDGVHLLKRLSLEEVQEVILDGEIPKTRKERRYSVLQIDVELEWSRVNEKLNRDEFQAKWLD